MKTLKQFVTETAEPFKPAFQAYVKGDRVKTKHGLGTVGDTAHGSKNGDPWYWHVMHDNGKADVHHYSDMKPVKTYNKR